MPFIQLPEGPLHYQLDGPRGVPVLLLSNSLGTDLRMWDPQMPALTRHFQVLRYDTRGHGQSLVTPGTYSMEQNGRDVLALLDALQLTKVSFCGLSMGGLIGQWLAINAPERLQRVVLCCTAARIGNPDIWNPRIEMVLRDGQAAMRALREASIARWFTAEFAQTHPEQVQPVVDMLAQTSPQGYAANCAAVRDADFRGQVGSITLPVLVVSGTADSVCPPADGRFITDQIAGAEFVEFAAAHLASIEVGDAFIERVLTFQQA